MLFDIDLKQFKELFPNDPHPFVSNSFIHLNRQKADQVVRLVSPENKSLGLVAGIKGGELKSPFSAPFGGFHFRHDLLYIREIDGFVNELIEYALANAIKSIHITLPPDLYYPTFNAKVNNVLLRSKFLLKAPDITNWVDLQRFNARFNFRSSREYFNQAVKNGLTFMACDLEADQHLIYDVIKENRRRMGRSIFMTFDDLKATSSLWPIDFFKVTTPENSIVAGAIFYRAHPTIVYAAFWGDSEAGRPLRAMDFLLFHLWSHYKKSNFQFIDLGISTEAGVPNEGLLRFKETHECASSLRYTFYWQA